MFSVYFLFCISLFFSDFFFFCFYFLCFCNLFFCIFIFFVFISLFFPFCLFSLFFLSHFFYLFSSLDFSSFRLIIVLSFILLLFRYFFYRCSLFQSIIQFFTQYPSVFFPFLFPQACFSFLSYFTFRSFIYCLKFPLLSTFLSILTIFSVTIVHLIKPPPFLFNQTFLFASFRDT